MYSIQGITASLNEISKITKEHKTYPATSPVLFDFYEEVDNNIESLLKEIRNKIKTDEKDVDAVFDTYQYRVRFITDYIIRKVYWFSYIKTAASCGIDKAYVLFNSEKDKEEIDSDIIDTNAFEYDEIPAYHSFCNCKVTLDKAKYEKQK